MIILESYSEGCFFILALCSIFWWFKKEGRMKKGIFLNFNPLSRNSKIIDIAQIAANVSFQIRGK